MSCVQLTSDGIIAAREAIGVLRTWGVWRLHATDATPRDMVFDSAERVMVQETGGGLRTNISLQHVPSVL